MRTCPRAAETHWSSERDRVLAWTRSLAGGEPDGSLGGGAFREERALPRGAEWVRAHGGCSPGLRKEAARRSGWSLPAGAVHTAPGLAWAWGALGQETEQLCRLGSPSQDGAGSSASLC